MMCFVERFQAKQVYKQTNDGLNNASWRQITAPVVKNILRITNQKGN